MSIIYPIEKDKNCNIKQSTIGIVGGGQLGKMLALEALAMGYRVISFTPKSSEVAPVQVCSHEIFYHDYTELNKLQEFADKCDVITFEFENIPDSALEFLKSYKKPIRPNCDSLRITQNRLRERNFLRKNKLPTHRFFHIQNGTDLERIFTDTDIERAILKKSSFGYDGKGQVKVSRGDDYSAIWENSGFEDAVLEEFVNFEQEISVIIARKSNDDYEIFPIGQNIHENGILVRSIIPASIEDSIRSQAQGIALKIANKLDYIGVMAVEMFILKSEEKCVNTNNNTRIYINEIAPRVHNSGHYSQDCCNISQFSQHIRAICGLNLIKPQLTCAKGEMINLIGSDIFQANEYLTKNQSCNIAADGYKTESFTHIYGKNSVKSGRKLGHINLRHKA